MSSKFMDEFSIDYIDNQFMESFYFNHNINKEGALEGFSYVDQFDHKLLRQLEDYKFNSIIMVYNFCYTNEIKGGLRVKFIDVYDYKLE